MGDLFLVKKKKKVLPCSCVHRLFEEQGRKEGHFSVRFGSQEGTLARILTSQGGSLVCFANQAGTLACFFGSQEGILACVFQQLGHGGGGRLPVHITAPMHIILCL